MCVFPKLWNHSLISSIYKSGDPNDCNNYRGISVTSFLGKQFTSLLQKRLTDYLEINKLISVDQGGFRSGYRTTDHIFILKTLINKYLHKLKSKLYACFVDFKKGFRQHRQKCSFPENRELIKDMYSNTLYSCKFDDSYSEPFLTTLGVKQRDSSNPTLFNIFVDDIKSRFIDNTKTKPVSLGVHTFNHLLYEDEFVILSESPTGLQNCINALDNYCEKWRFNINIKKTKVRILSKTERKAKTDSNAYLFDLNDNRLELVKEYKYIGLTVTCNGKLNYAAEILAQKARKAFFGLKANMPSSDIISVQNG